jgi:hypothetical protein
MEKRIGEERWAIVIDALQGSFADLNRRIIFPLEAIKLQIFAELISDIALFVMMK